MAIFRQLRTGSRQNFREHSAAIDHEKCFENPSCRHPSLKSAESHERQETYPHQVTALP
jgi:hypothetical protein